MKVFLLYQVPNKYDNSILYIFLVSLHLRRSNYNINHKGIQYAVATLIYKYYPLPLIYEEIFFHFSNHHYTFKKGLHTFLASTINNLLLSLVNYSKKNTFMLSRSKACKGEKQLKKTLPSFCPNYSLFTCKVCAESGSSVLFHLLYDSVGFNTQVEKSNLRHSYSMRNNHRGRYICIV